MFPSTLNRNLHKPTSGSKLRKSVTWDDLPPATTKQQITPTPSPSPATATPTPAPPASPTSLQRQHHQAKPSNTAAAQETGTEAEDDTPTTSPAGSRNYIHPGWSLLRAEQIRKHILALEGQHAYGQRGGNGDIGRRDSGFVDVVSGEMQVEYPELPDGNEEMEGMSRGVGYIGKGKGKERATEEGEGQQDQMEGVTVEYPNLPDAED